MSPEAIASFLFNWSKEQTHTAWLSLTFLTWLTQVGTAPIRCMQQLCNSLRWGLASKPPTHCTLFGAFAHDGHCPCTTYRVGLQSRWFCCDSCNKMPMIHTWTSMKVVKRFEWMLSLASFDSKQLYKARVLRLHNLSVLPIWFQGRCYS